MKRIEIEPLEIEKVRIYLDDESKGLCLKFSGDVDMRDTTIGFLPYLIKVHETLQQNAIKEVTVDFINLTYMNSNGIKSIINWIMRLDDLPDDKKYKIMIISNSEIAWQESTLPVLQKLFPNYISIINA